MLLLASFLLRRCQRAEQDANALADLGHLCVCVELDDALERADIIELQGLLNDGAPMGIPVGHARYLAPPGRSRLAVIMYFGGLADANPVGEFLLHLRSDDARPCRQEL